jgi:hypothetical protein
VVETGASNRLEEPGPMKTNSGYAERAIARIVELSADAQIARRLTVEDSPEFQNLTGAITAYGKALALLTALQQREEFYAIVAAA